MLTKKTSKNQITLPKAVVDQIPDVEYFEVTLRDGEIVLRPVVVTARGERLRKVREKIAELGMTEEDVERAVRWSRKRSA